MSTQETQKVKKPCPKCSRLLSTKEFYMTRVLTEKYPDGFLPECKKCLTMHVDNWDPQTYLWILEAIDVPYSERVWNKILSGYRDKPDKVTGMTILGKYLSQMKLKHWKDKCWADTAAIKEQEENEMRAALENSQNMTEEEIDNFIETARSNIQVENFLEDYQQTAAAPPPVQQSLEEKYFAENEFTEDDIRYLVLKWGDYKPHEWVKLEQLYTDMMESFDIQNAGHIDTLKLACKASLKTHQLLDLGDIDGAARSSKMYDSLMKSGKFTAAQNKGEGKEFIDSIGELVALCETEGYIERYYVESPKDKVDAVLADMNGYVETLVKGELNLGTLIDGALAKIQQQAEFEQRENLDDEEDEVITEQDFEDYFEQMEQEKEENDKLFMQEQEENFEIYLPGEEE